MAKSILYFATRLIVDLVKLGIDVALLFQQAFDMTDPSLGLAVVSISDLLEAADSLGYIYWSELVLQAMLDSTLAHTAIHRT